MKKNGNPRHFWHCLSLAGGIAMSFGCGGNNSVTQVEAPTSVPPVISAQPSPLVVSEGHEARFTVAANGTAPLGYQWRKGGVNLGGATTQTHVIPSAQLSHSGSYDVVVSNGVGSVVSAVAELTVQPLPIAPVITSQPSSLTVTQGTQASFNVDATGTTPMSYQWRKGGVNLSGATAQTHLIPSAQFGDVGSYDVVVSNGVGSAVSTAAILTVNPAPSAPVITASPASLVVMEGTSARFEVSATGTAPLDYQWRKGGVNLSGATVQTYLIPSAQFGDGGSYDVVVSNGVGSAVSTAAILSVNPAPSAPVITASPSSLSVMEGTSARFEVSATGTAPLDYQWRKGGVNLVGATTSTHTIPSAHLGDMGNYDVVVSNSVGNAVSAVATLTVQSLTIAPVITRQPLGGIVPQDEPVSFSVEATGTAPLIYQWRKGGVNLSGANAQFFSLPPVQPSDAGDYDVVVSNSAGSVISHTANLIVQPKGNIPVIAQQPGDMIAFDGETTVINMAWGGSPPFTITEYKSEKINQIIQNFQNNSISYGKTFYLPTKEEFIRWEIKNAFGSATTRICKIVILPTLKILAQPIDRVAALGEAVSLSIEISGTPPFSFQWRKDGVVIPGTATPTSNTISTYSLPSLKSSDYGIYDVVISDQNKTKTSDLFRLMPIGEAPVILSQSENVTVNEGVGATFNVRWNGTPPFAWELWKDGVLDASIPMISDYYRCDFVFGGVSQFNAGEYKLVVLNSWGRAESNPWKLTVVSPPRIVLQPASISTEAEKPASLRVEVQGTAPLTYQWRKNGIPLPGKTTVTTDLFSILSFDSLTSNDAGHYDVVISNGAGSITSSLVNVQVRGALLDLAIDSAYITQATQTYSGSVPLIAGRPGLLRVWILGDRPCNENPYVRASLKKAGQVIWSELRQFQESIPTDIDPNNLATTCNIPVPGEMIQSGISLLVELDPDQTIQEATKSNNVWPAQGGAKPLDVFAAPPLNATFIPILSGGRTGRVDASNAQAFLELTQKIHPLEKTTTEIHVPVETSHLFGQMGEGWHEILNELKVLKVAEGSTRNWIGIGQSEFVAGVRGMAYMDDKVLLGLDALPEGSETLAHELGHNWGRQHTLCGGEGDVDNAYPYPFGRIGTFGYDVYSGESKNPETFVDIMSYCRPYWISDYTYKSIMDARSAESAVQAAKTNPQPCLILWGRMKGKQVILEPAFHLDSVPSLPSPGAWTAEVLDGKGAVLLGVPFNMNQTTGSQEKIESGFAFAVPCPQELLESASAIRILHRGEVVQTRQATAAAPGTRAIKPSLDIRTGPSGESTLAWNAESIPAILVRDSVTGASLGILRGGRHVQRPMGAEVELILSDGIKSFKTLRRF